MSVPNALRVCRFLCFLLLFQLIASGLAIWAQPSSPAGDPNSSAGQGSARATKAPGEGPEEDWSSLALTKGVLQFSEPLRVEFDDDQPTFTREYLSVEWRRGDPIHLFVIRPKGVEKPPVILYLHSFPSETDPYRSDDNCRLMTKNGFAAVGFVSAMTGHRYHDRPLREWFVSNLQEALGSTVHDVQMILNYLETRKDLDTRRVGMFGDGSGATIAILASAVDPRLKVLDLIDPWGDWPDWLAKSTRIPDQERAEYLTLDFLKQVAPLDPVLRFPEVKAEKVRLQEVKDVTVTPSLARERIEAAVPPGSQIVRYENREAFFNEAVAGGKALDWLKQQVQGGDVQSYNANSGSNGVENSGSRPHRNR